MGLILHQLLLQVLSGEKIGHAGRGRLRINKIENVGKAILFLQEKKVQTFFNHSFCIQELARSNIHVCNMIINLPYRNVVDACDYV